MNRYKTELSKIKLEQCEKEKLRNLYAYGKSTNRRNFIMVKTKSFIKSAVAIAACLAVLCTVTLYNVDKNTGNDPFTLTVNAQEILKNDELPSTEHNFGFPQGWGFSGDPTKNEISFHFDTNFKVEGKNIEKITYKTNTDAFIVAAAPGISLLDQKECPALNVPYSYNDGDKITFLSEYSVKYTEQQPENVIFQICRSKNVTADDFTIIFNKKPVKPELEKKAYENLVGDIRISCTVTYKDGTTETIHIKPIVTIDNNSLNFNFQAL